MVSPEDLNFIDLFAGAGGFSLGLHQAGLRGIFAIERDPMAYSTLEHNLISSRNAFDWPSWLPRKAMDIKYLLATYRDELSNLSGTVDVVVGGPPCQGFSSAGRRVEHDERNMLFEEYVNFVRLVKPRAIVFENVLGFSHPFRKLDATGEAFSEKLSRALVDIGYESPVQKKLDFSDYGVPQSRKRLIVCSMERGADPGHVLEVITGKQSSHKIGVAGAISDLMRVHGEVDSPDSRLFKTGLYGPPQTRYQVEMRKGSQRSIPDSHRFARHSGEVVGRFHEIMESSSSSRNATKEYLKAHGLKKRDVRALKPDLPSPTLTSLPDDYIHYEEARILTVREYARIQSFPDWYEFHGNYTTGGMRRRNEAPRYTQVANAVAPKFAALAGKTLRDAL